VTGTYANAADVLEAMREELRAAFVPREPRPFILPPAQAELFREMFPGTAVVETATIPKQRGPNLRAGVVDEWSLRSIPPKAGVTASIVSAFGVPARMVVPRTGPLYDTAAIVAAQDHEWKDRQ
jgi:hypothetical protein